MVLLLFILTWVCYILFCWDDEGQGGVLLVPVFFYSCLTILVLYKFVLLSMWPILFFHRPIFLFLLHFVSVLEFVYFYIDQSLSSKILYFPFSPEFLLSDITALECPLCCFWRQKKKFLAMFLTHLNYIYSCLCFFFYIIFKHIYHSMGFPSGSAGKEFTCSVGTWV